MNKKSRSYLMFLKLFILLGVLVVFTSQSIADVSSIYKWKDDRGKTHFTDDPMKIPPRYRSDPSLEKTRGLPPPKLSLRQPSKPANPADANDTEEPNEKTADANADKKKNELAAMRDALNFLKSDIQRYEKYKDYLPEARHATLLKNDIVAALPAKEALEEKLGEYDSMVLKNVKSYLKKSLVQDNKAKDLWPRRRGFIVERTRINNEKSVKNQLINTLETKLASTSEKHPPNQNHLSRQSLKTPPRTTKLTRQ